MLQESANGVFWVYSVRSSLDFNPVISKFAGLFAFVTETAWVFMDLVNHLSLLQQPTLSAERPQAPTSFRFVVLCLALSCFAHCARS
jgi:hypothetical protein